MTVGNTMRFWTNNHQQSIKTSRNSPVSSENQFIAMQLFKPEKDRTQSVLLLRTICIGILNRFMY